MQLSYISLCIDLHMRWMVMYCVYVQYSPSGLYCATMVTVCPAFFRAAAACSCVAVDRSTPFTYTHTHTHTHTHTQLEPLPWIDINKCTVRATCTSWLNSNSQSTSHMFVHEYCVYFVSLSNADIYISTFIIWWLQTVWRDYQCFYSLTTKSCLKTMKAHFTLVKHKIQV